MQQHDATGIGGRDTVARHPRGPSGGDKASARASRGPRDRERGDEREAERAAVGRRAQARGDRDADTRHELDVEHRGQREESRELHLTRNNAVLGARQDQNRQREELSRRRVGVVSAGRLDGLGGGDRRGRDGRDEELFELDEGRRQVERHQIDRQPQSAHVRERRQRRREVLRHVQRLQLASWKQVEFIAVQRVRFAVEELRLQAPDSQSLWPIRRGESGR